MDIDYLAADDDAWWIKAENAAACFGETWAIMIDADGYPPEEVAALQSRYITDEHFAHLLLQALGSDGVGGFDKHKWLTIAEILGPDHCQSLYHAAVFATKVV